MKDNFTSSETTLDAILKIPNIYIDSKSTLNYKNRPVDIWIDEKAQNIPNNTLISLLRNMPIGLIYSIEVIQNPNVFYNTETDFLINIKTEHLLSTANLNLFNISIVQDENSKLNSYINFKRAYKKFFFQINTAFSAGDNIEKKENFTLVSNNLNTSANYDNTFVTNNRFFFETSIFYDLNFRDKIGVNFKHYSNTNNNVFNISKNLPQSSTHFLNNQQKTEFNDLEIYYLQKLDKGGTKFKMIGNLSSFEKPENFNDFNVSPPSNNFTYDLSQIGNLIYKKELFKADLIIPTTYLPFTLNTGFEYFKNTNSINLTLDRKVNFIVQQKNVYALVDKKINDFVFQIGLKVAKNKSQVDSLNINKNTYEFLPSAEVTYLVNKKNKITLSYTRKINQTNTLFINNLLITNDNFTSVNPDILFNTSHNVLTSFSYFNYNYLTLGFSRPNNIFIPFYDSIKNSLSFQTIHNPQYYNVNLSFPLTKNIFRLALKDYLQNFNDYSFSFSTGSNFLRYNKKTYSNYYLSINGKTNLFYDIDLLVNSSLITTNDWPLNANTKNLYKLDFSLNKYLFSNNLNISIGLNDLFNTFNRTTTSITENSYLEIVDSFNLQKVTLSAVYDFGTILKPKKNKKL